MNDEKNAIDFDAASKAWMENKKRLVNSRGLRIGYTYVCTYVHSDGKKCRKPVETCSERNNSGRLRYQEHVNFETERSGSGPKSGLFCRQHRNRKIKLN